MAKLKDLDWKDLPRSSKLANVLYPAHSEFGKQMNDAARQDGKKPPTGPQRLIDAERSYVSPLGGTAVRPTKGK